ncbi:glyoxalase [Defluviimonas sp. WL0002]|uniref:Glyoxalase n=1 Tax=Albidovulum marisflavi TaxID=2984159 RepID=A0ABT2Z7X0_9RHOB|nr:glyoxalase [Defluviimonas sp. WL0002]MCV2867230.1 glyoxalase [Defluviimonas sp. WL0002]
MDLETVSAADFGRSLKGLGLNLLVRDVLAEAEFLRFVFEMNAHRLSRDFAIMVYADGVFQLHSDGTFGAHPLLGLLPEAGPRGAGVEIRLYETDPDTAAARAAEVADAVVLQAPADKPHGLRECVILCPNGYAWVPSRRL